MLDEESLKEDLKGEVNQSEEEVVHSESTPSSEPLAASALDGLNASDKKKVILGSAIGGGILLGVIVTLIVLFVVESSKSHPTPQPRPVPDPIPHYNPYFVESYYEENERLTKIVAINKRKELEPPVTYTNSYGYIPIVRETYENYEPTILEILVYDYDEHLTQFLYLDPQLSRWHVPYFGNHSDPYARAARYAHVERRFKLKPYVNDSFQWFFKGRTSDDVVLISTVDCKLQYFDKYIEFEALLERDFIYGMGERIETFHLKNDNYSLWNRYHPYPPGGDTENGMYGSHPFILTRENDREPDAFNGIFMRNSNAMLFSMWDHAHNGTTINYKMVGGVIDLYLFHTADPQYIIRKYHSVIGRPYLPPIWAMGLHMARDGYTVSDFERIIDRHQNLTIPVDALWADTEMNENKRTFTVNKGTFSGIKELVQKMHDGKAGIDMRFVAIANPWIVKDQTYKYYAEAIKEGCLIMSARHLEQPFEGKTAAGTTVWLDFFNYNATLIWAGGLHDLHDLTHFDGIWISENEINHKCQGYCTPLETEADPTPSFILHNDSEFRYLQYRPTLDPLETDTIPLSAYHYENDMYHKQFYTHNLFGLQSAQATYAALYSIYDGQRFFVASRSTWAGSGQFASHWLDGNYATWESMASSIPSILNFNMFGIPHVGAPIGGYFGDCSPELLARWYELGSFYPLMLTYSSGLSNAKEPFGQPNVTTFIRNALGERYSLIRFMYTKMYEAHIWGGAVVHPLFFDFSNDTKVYDNRVLDRTFMWAHSLYIVPSLTPHQVEVGVYLPNWRWYNLRTYEMVTNYINGTIDGHYVTFEQHLGIITVLIKGGTIIPYQHLARQSLAMNVKDLEKIPAQIIIASDHTGRATGSYLLDEEGLTPYPNPRADTHRHYVFTYMNQIFRINKLSGFNFVTDHEYDYFWEIIILDVMGKQRVDFVCMMDDHMRKKELDFFKVSNGNGLVIHDERRRRISMRTLESIVWGSSDQHDFCRFQAQLTELDLSDNGRVMTGQLETVDHESYKIKYDLSAAALTNHIVHLTVAKNEGIKEWKVPDVVNRNTLEVRATKSLDAIGFGVSHPYSDFFFEMSDEHDPHSFWISTRNQPFVYVRNFIQVKFLVAGKHVFGLGERVGKFELGDGIYSIWNYDAMHEETGTLPGNNMYSSHPFYMIHTHDPKDFVGVFFLTSNAMDVHVKHISALTEMNHILSGGILELFLFGKGPAELIMREYHFIIGRPTPLPFWAFGYHQSRWGYKDIEHLKLLVDKFEEQNIPLDAVWMDKDFMIKYKSFTVDNKNWAGLNDFVKKLHEKGKHFVAIVDAGIAIDKSYDVYNRGLIQDVYIKSSFTREDLVGITWAGYSVWVDFLNTGSTSFWKATLRDFHALINFDGIWLDMNEPSNFCDGECPDHRTYHYYYFPLDYYDDLYYNPTHRPLEDDTISMEALHSGDEELANEFNYHNMYGYYQSKVTSNFFLETLNTRPFVVSSSTFPGSGHYATHWLGDNYSSWLDMKYSIAGMIHFNMFGIPFVGANICGYSGNATVNLCARWMQLGAFYPFMRNHNSPEGKPQEPYVDPQLARISKKAIQFRYSIARYIYTEYMHTVLRGGSMIKPLIFAYPDDNETYTIADTSFMLGPALRVTPIMEDNIDKIITYFPNANWYLLEAPDYRKDMEFNTTSTKGKNITLFASLVDGRMNVHMRQGHIIPMQEVNEGITNILKLQTLPINLLVTLDYHHNAIGELFYDSEHHTNFRVDHQDIMMHLHDSQIVFNITSGRHNIGYNHSDVFISKIIILDADVYKDTKVARYENVDNQTINMKAPAYDSTKRILTLESVNITSMNVLNLRRVYWSNTA
jgi:alpha-glucosidase (family GH31 glycosyl hydrolase)